MTMWSLTSDDKDNRARLDVYEHFGGSTTLLSKDLCTLGCGGGDGHDHDEDVFRWPPYPPCCLGNERNIHSAPAEHAALANDGTVLL